MSKRKGFSLAPLSLEEALRGAMKVDPNKLKDSPMPKKKRKTKKLRAR